MVVGIAPPMPIPVRNRRATSTGSDGAQADSSENTPNSRTETSSIGRRPKRSATGPATIAPTMMPMLDSANVWVNDAGGRPQAFTSDGTANPMALRS